MCCFDALRIWAYDRRNVLVCKMSLNHKIICFNGKDKLLLLYCPVRFPVQNLLRDLLDFVMMCCSLLIPVNDMSFCMCQRGQKKLKNNTLATKLAFLYRWVAFSGFSEGSASFSLYQYTNLCLNHAYLLLKEYLVWRLCTDRGTVPTWLNENRNTFIINIFNLSFIFNLKWFLKIFLVHHAGHTSKQVMLHLFALLNIGATTMSDVVQSPLKWGPTIKPGPQAEEMHDDL